MITYITIHISIYIHTYSFIYTQLYVYIYIYIQLFNLHACIQLNDISPNNKWKITQHRHRKSAFYIQHHQTNRPCSIAMFYGFNHMVFFEISGCPCHWNRTPLNPGKSYYLYIMYIYIYIYIYIRIYVSISSHYISGYILSDHHYAPLRVTISP